MNDVPPEQASTRRRRPRISPVWLIPVAAALIGCWLVYQNFISRGPQVTLELANAEGLQADNTTVKVRNVEVGHVTSIRLTDDYDGAIAVIQMNPNTEALLASDSRFWVVKPRIGRQGISGLGTILSGAYIQLRPGTKATMANHFRVLQHPPVTSADTSGVSITLTSDNASALNVGDPITFQGQAAGLVETAHFSVEHKRMRYRVFIKAPYSRIVTDTTQFWLRSGIDLHIGARGVDIRTGSLQTIFAGGATFGLPQGVDPGAPAIDGARFKLYPTQSDARQDRFDQKIPYLVLLDDSVRGLSDGAPVLYRGIRIGTVKKVPFFVPDYDYSELNAFRIPILITIEPQRVANLVDWTTDEWRSNLKIMFGHGLRATIKPANLLTGAMFISLQFMRDAPEYTTKQLGKYTVFPSVPGAINSIQQQISDLLDKFKKLQLGTLAESLQGTLKAIETATQSLDQLLGADATRQVAGDLQDTLQALQKTLAGYQQGAPMYRELSRSLDHLNQILDNLAPLIRTLNNKPNALIFGSDKSPDPVPRAAP